MIDHHVSRRKWLYVGVQSLMLGQDPVLYRIAGQKNPIATGWFSIVSWLNHVKSLSLSVQYPMG
jgi:hypothetical protein